MRICNYEALIAHGNKKGREIVAEILEAGLTAADPYHNLMSMLRIEGNTLYVGDNRFDPSGSPRTGTEKYDLTKIRRIFVIAVGKGIVRAAKALEEVLGDRITAGYVIAKHGDPEDLRYLTVIHGGHPIPDQACCDGCQKIVEMIEDAHLTSSDLVFTIVGNGVSSLLTLPPPGVSIDDVKEVTRVLQVEKGISTRELNYVRNQIDVLKSGRITRLLSPAKMVHLISIDVNEKEIDGSFGYDGLMRHNFWLHTMPDMTTPEAAIEILKENKAWESMSKPIRNYLKKGSGIPVLTAEEFEKMDCRVFGIMPNEIGVIPSAMQKAEELGYTPHLLARRTFLEASSMGIFLGRMAGLIEEEEIPFKTPCALIVGGEQLVTVGKSNGVGGRNQEFALAAALAIAGSGRIVAGAVDTDGTDGPGGDFEPSAAALGCTALAGAIVDGFTIKEAEEKEIDIQRALREHNVSGALWKLDSGIWATPSISLQDLIVVLIDTFI